MRIVIFLGLQISLHSPIQPCERDHAGCGAGDNFAVPVAPPPLGHGGKGDGNDGDLAEFDVDVES